MGKPRMIILVRHAQSEGNKNRDIHQYIPDHRVKLTAHGVAQAEEAGRQLRSLLKPDDTLQFFTSPYRRTRETTEGILRTLTGDDPTPSPFARHKIKVFEEPRLREQDFGNFQPCSAEMERMWQERADYGHFFYRIPNGESAADAYDRVSGFNESMWRQFGDEDFPSVCVLVTHGLMTRIFLMKWYHWSVEYFEDLRNVNHCEFIVMKLSPSNNKYILQNELRTWSELKRRTAAGAGAGNGAATTPSPSKGLPAPGELTRSPTIPMRRWGGCVSGCNHDKTNWPRRIMRKNTMDYLGNALPPPATPVGALKGEGEDHPIASQEADHTPGLAEPSMSKMARKPSTHKSVRMTPASPNDASNNSSTSDEGEANSEQEEAASSISGPQPRTAAIARHLKPPPSLTKSAHLGAQGEGFSDDSDYFPGMQHAYAHGGTYPHAHNHQQTAPNKTANGTHSKPRARATSKHRQRSKDRKYLRKMSEKDWQEETGMGIGARADALGDGDDISDNHRTSSSTPMDDEHSDEPILREAYKGDMLVERKEEQKEVNQEPNVPQVEKKLTEDDIDKMKEAERKGFGEIY